MSEANIAGEALAAEVRERLLARIAPNAPENDDQRQAFERAVAAQAAFEAEQGGALAAVRRGVRSFSVGGYSESYGAEGGDVLCPLARALLFNAGLLRRGMPAARRFP